MADETAKGNPPEIRVGIRELRGRLTHYLRQARSGVSVLVTSHSDIVAEIRAPGARLGTPRRPGALRGQIRMAPDFDTLPDEVLASLEE